jgi:plastocyanin
MHSHPVLQNCGGRHGVIDRRHVSPYEMFDSGDIAPGETFSYTFTEAGTFDYFCTPHPWMMGTVIVS